MVKSSADRVKAATSKARSNLGYRRTGDYPAERVFCVSVNQLTAAGGAGSTNTDWQQDLGELHRGSGDVAKAASDAAAGEEYEACAGISEPMVSRGSTNKKLAELAAYCRSQITTAGNSNGWAEASPAPIP